MRRLAFLILPFALASACKKPSVDSNPPLCKAEVAGSKAAEVSGGEVPADIWFLIMLRNFDREAMEVRRPVEDCSGRSVEPDEPGEHASCLAGEEPSARVPDRPLTEADLQITPTDDGGQMVWVRTSHFENGEAVGPLGITQWTARGVAVRALGTLRAFEHKAVMHLEPFGTEDKVLVVESRVCAPDNPKDCWRVMRLLPLVGGLFIDPPLLDADGTCLGPAQFRLYQSTVVERANNTSRKFEISRSIDFADGQIVVSESVTIKDQDTTQPDVPPSLFRQANLQRSLELRAGGLRTKTGLWEKMIAEHGSVEVRAEPPPESESPPESEPPP